MFRLISLRAMADELAKIAKVVTIGGVQRLLPEARKVVGAAEHGAAGVAAGAKRALPLPLHAHTPKSLLYQPGKSVEEMQEFLKKHSPGLQAVAAKGATEDIGASGIKHLATQNIPVPTGGRFRSPVGAAARAAEQTALTDAARIGGVNKQIGQEFEQWHSKYAPATPAQRAPQFPPAGTMQSGVRVRSTAPTPAAPLLAQASR